MVLAGGGACCVVVKRREKNIVEYGNDNQHNDSGANAKLNRLHTEPGARGFGWLVGTSPKFNKLY